MDQKSGFGIFSWPNGKKYEGFWVNGKQNGVGKYTHPDGKIEEGEWKDGKLASL